jgi:hypothetical protein
MSESHEPDEAVADRAKRVERVLGIRLPPHGWILLQSFTEDYLLSRRLLSLSRWRSAAEDLGVDSRDLRAAFDETDEPDPR